MTEHAPDTPERADDDGRVYPGEPLKLLGRYKRADGVEVARVGGYLVRFSTKADPDLTGDYFTADTDFGILSRKGRAEVPTYYQHGFDPRYGGKAIGDAALSLDEFGVWAEHQISVEDEYDEFILSRVEAGKMGQSSGAVAHLVKHKSVGDGVYEITRWPIGEGSLTPEPAEPRTRESTRRMKSLAEFKARLEAQEAAPPDTDTAAEPAPQDTTKTVPPDTTMTDQTPAPEANAPATEPEVKTAPAIVAPTADEIKAIVADAIKADREDRKPSPAAEFDVKGAPAIVKTLGDTEAKAFKAWALGDDGAMKHAISGTNRITVKASNNTDMNIGTAADGGNAVPTGHFGQIIARRDESRLNLGVREIPGVGTTVNVPLDSEDDGEFVSTAEAASNDRDAPALGTTAMTLVKYTKRIELSDELLADEESRLMAFIEDFIGRGMAKTHNDLLITEVETGGSALKTTASTTALAAGELEDAVWGNDLANYLGEGAGGGAWVMQPATYAKVLQLTGSDRLYAAQAQGSASGPSILGYGVNFSNKCEAYGTLSNKFALFGNFAYVGRREEPSFQVLRDPYSAATTGQVRLHYFFRTVYKVLQSEAVGYVQHAAA